MKTDIRTRSDFIGDDNECGLVAYFRSQGYKARRIGGFDDGGEDVEVWDHVNGVTVIVQSKSSVHHALLHLAKGIDMGRLIPVVVGDPLANPADYVLSSIDVDGFFVGEDAKVVGFREKMITLVGIIRGK